MIVNIDNAIKGIAAAVAGKCGCNVNLSDTIESLFPDDFKKQQMVDLVNQTYNLSITISELNQFSTLQNFSHFIGTLLINK